MNVRLPSHRYDRSCPRSGDIVDDPGLARQRGMGVSDPDFGGDGRRCGRRRSQQGSSGRGFIQVPRNHPEASSVDQVTATSEGGRYCTGQEPKEVNHRVAQ